MEYQHLVLHQAELNLIWDKFNLNKLFKPTKVEAAFELPPPNPAPMGMFL